VQHFCRGEDAGRTKSILLLYGFVENELKTYTVNEVINLMAANILWGLSSPLQHPNMLSSIHVLDFVSNN